MARILSGLALVLFVSLATGCQHHARVGGWGAGADCSSGPDGCASGGPELPANATNTGPTHTVNYPYYTLKGPRDFLMKNPASIGP